MSGLLVLTRSRAVCLVLWLLLLCTTRSATADLGSDVNALADTWSREGHVVRLAPQLHERGEARYLALPGSTLRSREAPCTTVAIVGVPSASFVLRFEPRERGVRPPPPLRSRTGIVEVTRCEAARRDLRHAVLELRSPRALLETLVLVAEGPPGEAYQSLPQRLPGPTESSMDAGPVPATPDIVPRARRLVATLTRRGASAVDHGLLKSDANGSGFSELELDAGCHELTVMGVTAPAATARGVDVDADLVWPGGAVAATDRADAPDAAIHLCVAQRRRLGLRFVGALPSSPVLFVHARWPLPPGLDTRWPPEVRAELATVLRTHRLRVPAHPPVVQALGIAGVTGIPVELEPDACYVVGVAVFRGSPVGVAAAVATGAHRFQNHGGPEGSGTGLAFCAQGQRTALVEVEAAGSGGLAWQLSMWQSGRIQPGAVVE